MTPEEIAAAIAQIDATLATGTTSASSDGESVQFDFAELRRQRAELVAMQPRQRYRERRVRTIDLSRSF